jgi:hypothetical protein
MGVAECIDKARHQRMRRRGRAEADGYAAFDADRDARSTARRKLDLAKYRLHIVAKRGARNRQLNASRNAFEKLSFELAFQSLDLLAQRRLLDAELLGRAGHAPCVGDSHEISQMPQLQYVLRCLRALQTSIFSTSAWCSCEIFYLRFA